MKKKSVLISCVLLLSVFGYAQNVTINEGDTIITIIEDPEPTSAVFVDGSSYNFIFQWERHSAHKAKETSKPDKSYWTGLGFAFSNLENLDKLNPSPDINLSRSYSVVLNLMDYTLPLSRHWLFATGLGFDWSRFHFKDNVGFRETAGGSRFVKDEFDRNYKSNKLLVYYATIPFLLEYQTKIGKHRHFFIYGGVEGLVKCYSKSQLDIRTSKGVEKDNYRNLNILPLNARLVLRTGFDNFSFFGYYQPFSMFEKGKGPDIRSFGIGFMLN